MKEPIKHVSEDGTIEYRLLNGKHHRKDGPAIIYGNGAQLWYQNGKLHREDGPAIIYENGTVEWRKKRWYQNGLLHREDGPAATRPNGSKEYWIDGIQYDPVTFLIRRYEQTS